MQGRQEIVAAKTHALIRKHRLTFYILTRCAAQAEIEPRVGLKGTSFSPYINPAKLAGFSPCGTAFSLNLTHYQRFSRLQAGPHWIDGANMKAVSESLRQKSSNNQGRCGAPLHDATISFAIFAINTSPSLSGVQLLS